jgi:fumarate reductase flavoprotein subunit
MMTKKLLMPGTLIAISLLAASCFVEYEPRGEAFESYSGTATGSAYGYGGTIEVTLTLTNGYITEVQINGPRETPTIGGLLIKNAGAQIEEANSLDAISSASATLTRNAIIQAGNKALAEITDGVYGSN